MKKKNCKCDYTDARNAELLKEFWARLGSKDHPTITSIFPRLASEAKASRFYISEDRAYSLIYRYRKYGEWPANMAPNKRRMMIDLLRRVETLEAFRPELTLVELVYVAVNSEAPSFYLTSSSIRTMLYASLAVGA